MTLSVLCTEDAPRLATLDTARLAAASPLGFPIAPELLAACADWPRGAPPDTTPVVSAAPVLILSGAFDPVTPPELADTAAIGLSHAERSVDPTAGHVMLYPPTVGRLVDFIRRHDAITAAAP
jgi:pimeloyl-ACP methyl ester carboxylesterase